MTDTTLPYQPARTNPGAIDELLHGRRVIACLGCGGVGKTSVAAALAVLGARRGRRVLALTVDPAKRLAQALGVDPAGRGPQQLSEAVRERLGLSFGQLEVVMLDPGTVWDETVTRLAKDKRSRDAILRHPLYVKLRDYLAGAQEYMAMERLLTALEEGSQDLVVLDTPPSRHSLDFLKAPDRLTEAIETPVMRLLGKVAGTRGVEWAARSAGALIGGLGKMTGGRMLSQLATLVGELNQVFGGLGARSGRVKEAFAQQSFGYLLVTRPNAPAIADAVHFAGMLNQQSRTADVVLVNRVHQFQLTELDQAAERRLEELVDPRLVQPIRSALSDYAETQRFEAECIRTLEEAELVSREHILTLPALPGGVRGVEELDALVQCLSAQRPVSAA